VCRSRDSSAANERPLPVTTCSAGAMRQMGETRRLPVLALSSRSAIIRQYELFLITTEVKGQRLKVSQTEMLKSRDQTGLDTKFLVSASVLVSGARFTKYLTIIS